MHPDLATDLGGTPPARAETVDIRGVSKKCQLSGVASIAPKNSNHALAIALPNVVHSLSARHFQECREQ